MNELQANIEGFAPEAEVDALRQEIERLKEKVEDIEVENSLLREALEMRVAKKNRARALANEMLDEAIDQLQKKDGIG